MTFPTGPDEASRIQALKDLGIANSMRDPVFNALSDLLKDFFQIPFCYVTLVKEDKVQFLGTTKLEVAEIPRELSYCTHTILSDEPLLVEDGLKDERFCNNPFVAGDESLRFYAGAPLVTQSGHRIGTLCMLAEEPRQLTADEIERLKRGAFVVMQMIEAYATAQRESGLNTKLLDEKVRLSRRNKEYELMSSMAKIGTWNIDLATSKEHWSAEVRRIHEVDDDYEPEFDSAIMFYPEPDRFTLEAGLQRCIKTGAPWDGVVRFNTAKGNQRWVHIAAQAVIEDGKVTKLFGALQDVTAATEARNELMVSQQRLELATSNAPIGLWDWNVVKDEFWSHPGWWKHLGYAEAMETRPDRLADEVIHPEDLATVISNREAFLEGNISTLVNEFRHRDGRGGWRWVQSTGRATEYAADGRVTRVSGVFVDVHDRMTTHERALYAASHDPMTNLVNREELKRVVVEALQNHQSEQDDFCLVAVDLDRFKFINDNFGHAAGDAVLKDAAARLRRAVRPDDVVARIGGDEFAIILKGGAKSSKYSASICNRILTSLRAPFEHEGKEHRISASIGIALAPVHGTDFDTLVRNADAALYQVKTSGKNSYCYFDDKIEARAASRRQLETDLRYAMDRNQLMLHFQPQIDLATGRVKSAEALLRWKHATRGMIPPDQFIPIAEDTGLIVPIGDWVILESCRTAAKWPSDVTVSVNLSPLQLANNNLFDAVMHALTSTGVAPRRLELEVTESVFLNEHDTPLTDLLRLHDLGVRLALDDFGTGYASLSYLKKLPFDKIKIDRSFISDVATNQQSSAIICAVANLASSLGLDTTAEGIETDEQAQLARTAGCRLGQGYLYSKPVPASSLFNSDNHMIRQAFG